MSAEDTNEPELRTLDPEDGRTISDAYEVLSVLGEDYMPVEKLLHHARHNVVIGAFGEGELTGVVVAHPLSPEDFKVLERRMGSDRLESLSLPRAGKTGTVDALAVRKSYRRMGKGEGPGVGTVLLYEAVSRLKDSGCEMLFAESWASGSGDESKNLVLRSGGELKLEVPGYWSSDGVHCPVCNSTDCKCRALIFVNPL